MPVDVDNLPFLRHGVGWVEMVNTHHFWTEFEFLPGYYVRHVF